MLRIYLFTMLFIIMTSCSSDLRPDTYIDYYVEAIFQDSIDALEVEFEFARLKGRDIQDGSSYINTLELNPVSFTIDQEMNSRFYLGDSEIWETEIEGFNLRINSIGIVSQNTTKYFERCEENLPFFPYEKTIMEGDKKSILFRILLEDSIEGDCITPMIEIIEL